MLERLVAGIEVTSDDIKAMGAGGLLMEIATRGQPRAGTSTTEPARAPRIAALILAAGQSRRMGKRNKLLAEIDGVPMVAGAVDAALASQASPVVVVTGHEPERVRACLAGRPTRFAHSPDHGEGLSHSLRAGLDALDDDIDGVVVLLGDMPRVTARHIDRLIAAFDPLEGRSLCVPTRDGKRGNPVLFARHLFDEMRRVAGDVGARHLIGAHEDELVEVAMEDDAIFVDVDTAASADRAHEPLELRPSDGAKICFRNSISMPLAPKASRLSCVAPGMNTAVFGSTAAWNSSRPRTTGDDAIRLAVDHQQGGRRCERSARANRSDPSSTASPG